MEVNDKSLERLVKKVIREEKLQELDKTTYDSAAKKASDKGMSSLSDRFKKHGEEHGLGKEKEIFTLVFKDRDGEHEQTYKVNNIEVDGKQFKMKLDGHDNSNYEEQDQITHNFAGFLSKSIQLDQNTPGNVIKVWKSGEWRALAKTRLDAKRLLNILNINGVDTRNVDPRSLTYGYSNFDESIKRRKTLSEKKLNKINEAKKCYNINTVLSAWNDGLSVGLNSTSSGNAIPYWEEFKKQMGILESKEINEDRTDYEMSGARSRSDYTSNPRERDITGMFGKYAGDVPPIVIRYLRKNPEAIVKRLYKIYGDKIYDYLPQQEMEEGYDSYMDDVHEDDKWIQKAVEKPGSLRRKMGLKKGEKLTSTDIRNKMAQLKRKDKDPKKKGVQGLGKRDLKTYRQLNLAKTLRGL